MSIMKPFHYFLGYIYTSKMLLWDILRLIILLHNLESSDSIRWPNGTYGIPKPASGCPSADGFKWQEGWRSQDTNNWNSNNGKSQEFHLDGAVNKDTVKRSFCVKTDTTNDKDRPTWSTGQYCIYKKGKCPSGLTQGYVFWDDDNVFNSNKKEGELPDGDYDKNTKIWFCCKTDGDKNQPVILPTETPFFLLAYGSDKCQMVKWAIASLEWIYYDTEDAFNSDARGGAYPYNAGTRNPKIYYCYYRGCNETLTGVSGTFHSPNYPQKYPDGQYCSWRITVSPAQQIHLTFTDFSLQSDNNTDSLYVYDGENATGQVLGEYYGGHPPPKDGINSSSNHMLVIFKSDKSVSDTGFRASYTAVNYSEPSVATTTIPNQEVTSPATITSKPLHTSDKTTTSGEPTATTKGPSNGINKSGENKQRQKSEGKGLNIVAVVVPVVALVLLVALLVAGFFFCKRRRTKKQNQGSPKEVVYLRSNDETPMSLENPYYDRDLTVGNTAYSPEESELYTDVKEEHKNEENENPLYEAAGDDAVLNPIYDSDLITENAVYSSAEDKLYTDAKEERNNEKDACILQENENPLYETEASDAPVLNPIYDSSN